MSVTHSIFYTPGLRPDIRLLRPMQYVAFVARAISISQVGNACSQTCARYLVLLLNAPSSDGSTLCGKILGLRVRSAGMYLINNAHSNPSLMTTPLTSLHS